MAWLQYMREVLGISEVLVSQSETNFQDEKYFLFWSGSAADESTAQKILQSLRWPKNATHLQHIESPKDLLALQGNLQAAYKICVLGQDIATANPWIESMPARLLVTYSISEMNQNPQIKKQAWADMQPLLGEA